MSCKHETSCVQNNSETILRVYIEDNDLLHNLHTSPVSVTTFSMILLRIAFTIVSDVLTIT